VRVPKANVGPLVIPPGLADEQVLFLSDILPTGYQAAVNGEVGPGSTVAIFGAGPVGLMAAASARLLGAERIFMVDHTPTGSSSRAATYGVEPINFDIDDPAGPSSTAPTAAASMRRSTRSASRPRAARWKRC
jgi:threonine dehydrogenase-like Zn-dependent dehydrogenase